MKTLIDTKLQVTSGQWHLLESYDGINIYADQKDADVKMDN